MALPFLNPRKTASIIMAKMTPKGVESEKEEGEHSPEFMKAVEDLMSAIAMKDSKAAADALKMCMGGEA